MNPTDAFIAHAKSVRWSALPEAARRAAKNFLHDTICVGVAGARAPYADAILKTASGWGDGKAGGVLGRREVRLPAAQAAFVNAFQIHGQEFDCVHEPAVVHPLATILSAVMAVSERDGPVRGDDVLAALVAGVDVAAGLGIAAKTPLKFFRPATAGIFGSVAALVRLGMLDDETARNAFGFALAFASGTMQAHDEGKPALPVQIANAARGAVEAVDLARNGMMAAHRAIDGPFGYLPLFETRSELAPVLDALGATFRIAELSWKPFPTGRAAHGAIVATQTLMRDHGVTSKNCVRLVYRAPPLIKRLVGRDAVADMKPAYARLCFPYLGAVVLRRGTVGLGDFAEDRLGDPEILRLARAIAVEDDGNPDPAAFVPAVATALLADGRTATVRVEAQYGSPAWPLGESEHRAKAKACLAFADCGAIDAPLAAEIAAYETAADGARLFRLAMGGPEKVRGAEP